MAPRRPISPQSWEWKGASRLEILSFQPVRRHARHFAVVTAAIVPSLLYLVFVSHYSVNVPYADDWAMIPVANSALHGHLSIHQLWFQWADTRLFIPALVFVTFAQVDHLNVQAVLLFSAGIFIASYLLLLVLLSSYLTKRLTFLPVFVIGIVWFSLVDVQNALWSFQVAWYLATFFFVAMIAALMIPSHHRSIFLGLGIVAAVAGSYSIIQGFVLWPIGLICVLWKGPWGRRTYFEMATWIGAAAVTIFIYLRGFYTANVECPQTPSCSPSFGVLHPLVLARYITLLAGNVVPTSFYAVHPDILVHEVLGTGILMAAAFVVVQSIRERRERANPLPLLLILFGALFDLAIAIGRVGGGLTGALNDNRYTMPNLILLCGVVIYAFGRPLQLRLRFRRAAGHRWVETLGFAVLGAFLVVQCVVTTSFGIGNARATHQTHEIDARVVVNFQNIPMAQQSCDASFAVLPLFNPADAFQYLHLYRNEIASSHLSVFEPSTQRLYASQGLPTKRAIIGAADFAAVPTQWRVTCR